jgi:hypothetical protein
MKNIYVFTRIEDNVEVGQCYAGTLEDANRIMREQAELVNETWVEEEYEVNIIDDNL